MKTVVTHDNKEASVRSVVKIDDKYYLKKECIKVGLSYYLPDDPRVVFNVEENKYERKVGSHVFGICINDKNKLVFGFFKRKHFSFNFNDKDGFLTNVPEYKTILDKHNVLYSAIPVSNYYSFCKYFQINIHWDGVTTETFSTGIKKIPTEGLPYEVAEVNTGIIGLKANVTYNSLDPELVEKLKKWGALLSHSVGVEYETYSGTLPSSWCNKFGLVKLRDGSLKGGFEYSTIPFSKDQALFFNIIIPYMLGHTHSLSMNCSLHIHLGGFPRDKKKILCLYLLLYRLQQEVNEFIPPYRKTREFIENIIIPAGKDYCADLPNLSLKEIDLIDNWEAAFDRFFLFLTSGVRPNAQYNFDTKIHPVKAKYNRKARYHNFNLLPMVFGSTETVEARVHTATLNPYKIIAWIFINNAILEFVENNVDKILNREKIDIQDIIAVYKNKGEIGQEMFQFLFEYIEERKNTFGEHFIYNHSHYSYYEESELDSIFVPQYVPNELQTIFKSIQELFTRETN